MHRIVDACMPRHKHMDEISRKLKLAHAFIQLGSWHLVKGLCEINGHHECPIQWYRSSTLVPLMEVFSVCLQFMPHLSTVLEYAS